LYKLPHSGWLGIGAGYIWNTRRSPSNSAINDLFFASYLIFFLQTLDTRPAIFSSTMTVFSLIEAGALAASFPISPDFFRRPTLQRRREWLELFSSPLQLNFSSTSQAFLVLRSPPGTFLDSVNHRSTPLPCNYVDPLNYPPPDEIPLGVSSALYSTTPPPASRPASSLIFST